MANIDWRDYEDLEEQAFEKMSTPTSKKKKSWKQIQDETRGKGKVKSKKRRKGSLEKKNRKNTNS